MSLSVLVFLLALFNSVSYNSQEAGRRRRTVLGAVFERMSENTHRLAGDFINSYLLHCAVLAALVYIGVCAVHKLSKAGGR